jgi:hypothetical protein
MDCRVKPGNDGFNTAAALVQRAALLRRTGTVTDTARHARA